MTNSLFIDGQWTAGNADQLTSYDPATGEGSLLRDTDLAEVDLAPNALAGSAPMPEVEKIRSSFALKQVRYKTALPLQALESADR